jgi:hypothetical protein
MADEPFMNLVVDCVLFFEQSSDDFIDEDSAIQMLEQIAATLQRLDASTQPRFLLHLQERVEQAESPDQRQAIERVAVALGIDSE